MRKSCYPDPTLPLITISLFLFLIIILVSYIAGDFIIIKKVFKFVSILILIFIILIPLGYLFDRYQINKYKKAEAKYISNFESFVKQSYDENKIILLDRLTNEILLYDEFIKLKESATSIDYNYKLKKVKVNYPYKEICRLNFSGKRSICVMIIEK